jgi:cysteine synthase A
LPKGGTVVEYTGGSTVVSLALACFVKGYIAKIVTSDAFSDEKRKHMKALGAELTVVPSIDGGMDAALTRKMIAAARAITEETGAFWTDQLNNADQVAGYQKMGEEIWLQTTGNIDSFVQMVRTGGCVRWVANVLLRFNPHIHIVAVEPSESAVLSGGQTGVHKIESTGAGFVVPLWDSGIVSDDLHGIDPGSHGNVTQAGSRRIVVRWHVNRRQCRCRPESGGPAGGRSNRCNHNVGLGNHILEQAPL